MEGGPALARCVRPLRQQRRQGQRSAAAEAPGRRATRPASWRSRCRLRSRALAAPRDGDTCDTCASRPCSAGCRDVGLRPRSGRRLRLRPPQRPRTSERRPRGARGTGPTATIRSIRRSVLPDAVRIIIELDGEVAFHEERIAGPDRVFVDLSPARAAASLHRPDASVQQRCRRRPADPPRPPRESHDACRARCRRRLDLQRLRALQPLPAGHRLRARETCAAARSGSCHSWPRRRLSPPWGRQLPSATSHNAALIRSAVASAQVVPPPVNATGQPRVACAASATARIKSADLPGVQAVIVRAAPPPPPPAPRLLVAKPLAPTVDPDTVSRRVSAEHCGHPRGGCVAAAAARARVPARPRHGRARGITQEQSHDRRASFRPSDRRRPRRT